jgi:hypothetical protein
LKPSTVRKMAGPAKKPTQGACSSSRRPMASMIPQDGIGGWVPHPRNEWAASVRMAKKTQKEHSTSRGARPRHLLPRPLVQPGGRRPARPPRPQGLLSRPRHTGISPRHTPNRMRPAPKIRRGTPPKRRCAS